MPVVWTDRHRGHAPDGGYWLGVRLRGRRGTRARRRAARPTRWPQERRSSRRAGPRAGAGAVGARRGVRRLPAARATRSGWLRATSPTLGNRRSCRTSSPCRASPPGRDADTAAGQHPCRDRSLRHRHADVDQRAHVRGSLCRPCTRRCTPRRLVADGAPAAYAAVRPPGHHAGPAYFGGSCYFNNAAAAAQHLRNARRAARGDRRHRRAPGQRHAGDLLVARRRALRERARRPRRRLVPALRGPRGRDRWRQREGRHGEPAAAAGHG